MMKIDYFSDLHLNFFNTIKTFDFESIFPEKIESDILLFAGDLSSNITSEYSKEKIKKFLKIASKKYKKIFLVLGNHDYWCKDEIVDFKFIPIKFFGEVLGSTDMPPNITLLTDKKVVKLSDDITLIGSTLWTVVPEKSIDFIRRYMNDYEYMFTKNEDGKIRECKVEDLNESSKNSFRLISEYVTSHKDEKIIILTHHAPSFMSGRFDFTSIKTNCAFCNDFESFIKENTNIKFWIHGHTHDKHNYKIGETTVLCNPCGYPIYEKRLNEERTSFLQGSVIETFEI